MAHAQSKRHTRKYESEDFVKGWDKNPPKSIETLVAGLAAWMRDLKSWGEDVRDDIIRLESAVGAAPGEPGDPPPAPRT
jgi:hypothetical protein